MLPFRLYTNEQIEGVLSKWPYPPCLRVADRAHLAGYLYKHDQFQDMYTLSINLKEIFIANLNGEFIVIPLS